MEIEKKILIDLLISQNLEEPKAECKCCGMCCKAFILIHPKDYIDREAKTPDANSDYIFASKNFVQITEEEAFKINPYLKLKNLFSYNCAKEDEYYYTCLIFNKETNKCRDHKNRPRLCREFPWYGRRPFRQRLYSSDCAYHNDLKTIKTGEKR